MMTPSVAAVPTVRRVSTDSPMTWAETASRSFVPLAVTSSNAERFHAVLNGVQWGDVFVSKVQVGRDGHAVERTIEHIEGSQGSYIKLSLQVSGTGVLVQDGRDAVLRPGDVAIYDTSRPYTLAFDGPMESVIIMFPRLLLPVPAEVISRLTAITLPRDRGVARLVGPFLTQLGDNLDTLSGSTGLRVVHSTIDLITTMLGSDLPLTAEGGDQHAARLYGIHSFIDANLSSADLDPDAVAAAAFISTGHLHALFRSQGHTVSELIRARRLEHVRRDLEDPLLVGRSIAAIASSWGYPDAAHFSKVFKSACGVSPREYRIAARTHDVRAQPTG